MRSYHSHLQQLVGPSTTEISLRKPTFRSSAIFPVIHMPGISTRVCYLGYWMIKRNIQEIHSVITLRASNGEILYRFNKLIEEPKTYRIETAELLIQVGLDENIDFLGSLEIEFFAAHDLVFAYPAVVVNYYGSTFSSVVHTAQRIFNDGEDKKNNLEVMVPEAGFTVYADEDRQPFFCFINGFEHVNHCKVTMHFYNHKNEIRQHELLIEELLPYQTSLIHPTHSLDLQSFFEGKPGTAKISFHVKWVFPRVIAGNYQHSLNALSVTHTYYDCTEADSPSDYWLDAPPEYHAASLMIPLSLKDARYTNVYLYPIYSPSTFVLDVEIYSNDGLVLGTEYGAQQFHSPGGKMELISLKSICDNLNIHPDTASGAKIIARPLYGSKLPTRIKVGLDYGIHTTGLPCNICKNLDVFNPQLEIKKRSFHWAPVLADQEDSFIWLINGTPLKNYNKEAKIKLTFYREKDSLSFEKNIILAPNGTVCIHIKKDAEICDFFGGTVGWYTAISENPYVTTYYLCENSSGVVGGDHDF